MTTKADRESPVKRPLWQCLRCGRRFANRNQAHSCSRSTVADYLRGKSETGIAIYKTFERAVRDCGEVRIHPAKTRVGFIARMTFANACVKRDRVEAGMYLPYRSSSARFHNFLAHGQGGMHTLWLDSVDQIDDEVRAWLAEAYSLGMQETPASPLKPAKAQPRSARRTAFKPIGTSKGLVFFFHWDEDELRQMAEPLRAAGHDVRTHWNTTKLPKFGDHLPDIFVICLDRRPSHGRGYASWIRLVKKRQGIPILFVGGDPAKVRIIRTQFPDDIFTSVDKLPQMVGRLLGV